MAGMHNGLLGVFKTAKKLVHVSHLPLAQHLPVFSISLSIVRSPFNFIKNRVLTSY